MTDPTLEEIRTRYLPRLNEELAALHEASAQTAADREPVELDQQRVGRLSRMDAIQQQAMASAQDARRKGRGRALQAALERMESGDFGWCAECGEFIGVKRLDLDPSFTRCVNCAR